MATATVASKSAQRQGNPLWAVLASSITTASVVALPMTWSYAHRLVFEHGLTSCRKLLATESYDSAVATGCRELALSTAWRQAWVATTIATLLLLAAAVYALMRSRASFSNVRVFVGNGWSGFVLAALLAAAAMLTMYYMLEAAQAIVATSMAYREYLG